MANLIIKAGEFSTSDVDMYFGALVFSGDFISHKAYCRKYIPTSYRFKSSANLRVFLDCTGPIHVDAHVQIKNSYGAVLNSENYTINNPAGVGAYQQVLTISADSLFHPNGMILDLVLTRDRSIYIDDTSANDVKISSVEFV